MSVDDLLADGRLELVHADPEGSQQALEEARLHAASAEAIRTNDPNGAYQLAYDSARKAVMAHMRSAGLRIRRGDGAHAFGAQYAEAAISDELGRKLESMRRRRNRSEYGNVLFGSDEVTAAISAARALIDAVSG